MEKKVVLVEDHPALREALALVIEMEGFRVEQAGSLVEARTILEQRLDVAIVDLHLPDGDGASIIRELLEVSPRTSVLVLTASSNRAEWGEAVEAGASGILNKSASLPEILRTIRRLVAGEELLSRTEAIELMRFASEKRERESLARFAASGLTARERQVLGALGEGLDDQQIAHRLGVELETVHAHLVRVYSKLGVHSRIGAVVFAARHGLVNLTAAA